MSNDTAGALIWFATGLGLWVLRRSYRTGESPTAWPFNVTRATKPNLYWFDMTIVCASTITCAVLSIVWLVRRVTG
jgi:hypothetical protein